MKTYATFMVGGPTRARIYCLSHPVEDRPALRHGPWLSVRDLTTFRGGPVFESRRRKPDMGERVRDPNSFPGIVEVFREIFVRTTMDERAKKNPGNTPVEHLSLRRDHPEDCRKGERHRER